jgi:spore germination protein GerM
VTAVRSHRTSPGARGARRPAAALAALLLAASALGACGIPADDGPRAISPDSVPADDETTAPADDGQTLRASLFFTRFDGDRNVLVEAARDVPAGGSSSTPTPATVLDELLAGPQDTDEPGNLVTSIPADTSLASPPVLRSDILSVNLNAGIAGVQADGARLAYGQMVCTATALVEVTSVRFTVEGHRLDPPTGEGESSDTPLTCNDYDNLFESADR